VYEIGMCNLGLGIIYDDLNRQPDVLAERVFAPWNDMEDALRGAGVPLFSLESKRPVRDFDIVGFSLGYELTYSNALNLLDLAQIPVLAAERGDSLPLVIAGGSCALNPEPMADFIDLFVVGEGEEAVLDLIEVFRSWRREGSGRKREFLQEAARVPGLYVPSFYDVAYRPDGTVSSITPSVAEASPVIERRIVSSLPDPLTRPIVPHLEVIHDRGAVEIQRGCSQGCRFCQAGMIYRPVRERPKEEVVRAVDEVVRNCGYDEISLLSLSSSDYPDIMNVINTLSRKYKGRSLTLSLPSLRLDSFSVELATQLQGGRRGGFTFAPEAGTERLRRVINKDIAEEDILKAITASWERGWKSVKLYFMIGLPTETIADVEEIVRLVRRVRTIGGGRINVRVNASTFVPKARTPFQWAAQALGEDLAARHQVLRAGLKKSGVHLSWQDPEVSLLEGVFSRGDRRLGRVIHDAWKRGSRLDAWSEHYDWEKWQGAFADSGLDPLFYACRERAVDEILPWSHIDAGVDADFLWKEYERSTLEQETPDCRSGACNLCGLERSNGSCQRKHEKLSAGSKASSPESS
ncbi:MAG: TIGR03960 family B12-binding radical SAM protein, partial [Dehalococcoidia bacterium]